MKSTTVIRKLQVVQLIIITKQAFNHKELKFINEAELEFRLTLCNPTN